MTRLALAPCCALGLVAGLSAAEPALNGLDPVALCQGREQPGDPAITATAGRFTYRFATDDSRKTFLAEPERYGIQFGGACMRMGPLSGYGSPARWDVHDGRIYLFASDGCRAAFRADPKTFIDRPDPPAEGTEAQVTRAAGLMAKAVAAAGGERRLKELKTWQVRTKLTSPPRDGNTAESTRTFAASFPDRAAAEWVASAGARYGWVSSPRESYRTSATEWEKVDDQVRHYLAREVARRPLWLLHAWVTGRAKAVAVGPSTDGDREVERVAVSLDGATTTLGIDPRHGTIRSAAYRGRAGLGIADLRRDYSDYKTVNGVAVPFRVETSVNGTRAAGGTKAEIEAVLIDEPIPAGLLRKPSPPSAP